MEIIVQTESCLILCDLTVKYLKNINTFVELFIQLVTILFS